MKKIASFTYAVIFALSTVLIGILIVVIIGKYDYKWEYINKIPDIDPEYGIIGETTSGGETTLVPTKDMKAVLSIDKVTMGKIDAADMQRKWRIDIKETKGGKAEISYIEYSMYADDVCIGVYYESFEVDYKKEFSTIEGLGGLGWNARLPFDANVTLLKIKLVWTDEDQTVGETTISYDMREKVYY